MKYLLAALLALPLFATAAPMPEVEVRGLVAQIDAVMDSGLCAVANDTSDHGTETMTVVLRQPDNSVLVRQILVNDWNYMRSGGYTKTPGGRWLMSERAEQSCRADATGGVCFSFRSFYVRFFPSARRPGNGVRIVPL